MCSNCCWRHGHMDCMQGWKGLYVMDPESELSQIGSFGYCHPDLPDILFHRLDWPCCYDCCNMHRHDTCYKESCKNTCNGMPDCACDIILSPVNIYSLKSL